MYEYEMAFPTLWRWVNGLTAVSACPYRTLTPPVNWENLGVTPPPPPPHEIVNRTHPLLVPVLLPTGSCSSSGAVCAVIVA